MSSLKRAQADEATAVDLVRSNAPSGARDSGDEWRV